jgi:putative ABC transport system ATP-binding protein
VTASSVVVRSVTKTYWRGPREITALEDVSFELLAGEVALFVGPSGSGKTTLLNLIAALDRPDRGKIIVGEFEITGLSRSAAARYRNERVGFIFQSYNLLPQLTALENILLPMLPNRRADRRRAAELLDAVGLSDRSTHRPAELSGGEQQRVAIARALANDPALILADEPTGNLDDDNALKVAELLSVTCRERGKTLILVTHDRQMIRPVDRVFEMRDGWLTMIESESASCASGP